MFLTHAMALTKHDALHFFERCPEPAQGWGNEHTQTRAKVKQVEWPPDRPNPNNPVQALLLSPGVPASLEDVEGI